MVKLTKEDLRAIIDGVWSRLSAKLAGKADSVHTHPAQSSVTGNAGTATKLQTGRKIGNASFDGSANITLEQMGAAASHGTHVTYSTGAPKAAGTAAAGSTGAVARADHVHPLQTSVSGNAGTATKLQTARKIGDASFNGSANITLAQMGAEPLPVVGSITLTKAGWTQDSTTKLYKQAKTITGLVAKHRVDLDIDYATEMDLPAAIRPVNNNGSFYAVTAEIPEKDITAQYTLILTK